MKQSLCLKTLLYSFWAIVIYAGLTNIVFAKKMQQSHPHYTTALYYLRTARWLIDHRPGNWEEGVDELKAVRYIDTVIYEIKMAGIDDGKGVNDRLQAEDSDSHVGRLKLARDFLNQGYAEIKLEVDNSFAQGLRHRVFRYIAESTIAVRKATFVAAGIGTHPNYFAALDNLRGARWLLEHNNGDWIQTKDEHEAERRIEDAINVMKKASIDDGQKLEDHGGFPEPDGHSGHLGLSIEFLISARQHISKEEENGTTNGLNTIVISHIDAALALLNSVLHS